MCNCNGETPPLPDWNLGDGRVKFPDTAPHVDGYVVDPDDPTILVPLSPRCTYEVRGLAQGRLMAVCRHPESPHKFQQVDQSICDSCPLYSAQG